MMRRENYKSDLRLVVTLTLGGTAIGVPDHDFGLRFFTDDPRASYVCYRKGDEWFNCKQEGDKVVCFLNHHRLGLGQLLCEFYDFAPDSDFADGNQLKVVPCMLDLELVEDAGDDAMNIEAEVVIDIVGALADVRAAVARLNELLDSLQCEKDGFFYVDAAGNIAFRYTPADGLDAAKVSRHLSDLILLRLVTDEDGFYYTDAAGNVALKYTPGDGFDVAKVSEHLKWLILSGFITNIDGLFYTDAAGNVALKYTPGEGFDVAKVSEHFKSLLPAGGGGDYIDLTETIYNI